MTDTNYFGRSECDRRLCNLPPALLAAMPLHCKRSLVDDQEWLIALSESDEWEALGPGTGPDLSRWRRISTLLDAGIIRAGRGTMPRAIVGSVVKFRLKALLEES